MLTISLHWFVRLVLKLGQYLVHLEINWVFLVRLQFLEGFLAHCLEHQ